MKFLVTGSAGLVGRQVIKDLAESYDKIYSCYHSSKPEFGVPTPMDLTNAGNIAKIIESTRPDVIIHLAAMTDVDLCEKEKDLASRINADATEIISKHAARQRAFFLYVSTDYVFDGKNGMKKESDTPNPINHYGKSKLDGENAVRDLASSWCITRTSTPFGIHPVRKSFPVWVAKSLQENKEIKAITDQYTSPTHIKNLSKMIIEIATRQIVGIMHVAGATRISRYEIAEMIADKLNLDKKLLKQTTIDEMDWIAKRPKDSSLDVSKTTSILKEKPLRIEQGIDYFIRELELGSTN